MQEEARNRRVPNVGFALHGDSPVRIRGRGVPSRSAPALSLSESLREQIRSAGAGQQAGDVNGPRSGGDSPQDRPRSKRPSFDEVIRPVDTEAAALALPDGLAEVLDGLQKGFIQISHVLRHGIRSLGSEDAASVDGSLVDPTEHDVTRNKPGLMHRGLHGRTVATREAGHSSIGEQWQREVLRQDQRAASILIEALRGTRRVCTVALETHEGVVDLSGDMSDDVSDDDEAEAEGREAGNADTAAAATAERPAAGDDVPWYLAEMIAAGVDLGGVATSTSAPPPPSEASPPGPGPGVVPGPPVVAPRSPQTHRRRKGLFAVVLDPLGHALNSDAGVSVGTIFGVYPLTSADRARFGPNLASHVLRPAKELVAAGYALYGASTQLVLSCGHGVDGFTLHPKKEDFILTRPSLQLPPVGRFYSVNLGHRRSWSSAVDAHIETVTATKSLRYIGTFVADVHRTLLYGGIFYYPPSAKRPAGKLRLLYEVGPIAFLVEQAGGDCTTGLERLLDIQPARCNTCVPVALGSSRDVEAYVRAHRNAVSDAGAGAGANADVDTQRGLLDLGLPRNAGSRKQRAMPRVVSGQTRLDAGRNPLLASAQSAAGADQAPSDDSDGHLSSSSMDSAHTGTPSLDCSLRDGDRREEDEEDPDRLRTARHAAHALLGETTSSMDEEEKEEADELPWWAAEMAAAQSAC